jgi:hypothetical protein
VGRIPRLPGVLSADQARATAASIAHAQERSGAIPWFPGGHTDPWDHVQSAMGLTAAGWITEARRAFAWSRRTQRPDGSWAIRYDQDDVTDAGTDANFCAYLATGVWHHWRVTGDRDLVESMWPAVRGGIEVALSLQQPMGHIVWCRDEFGAPAAEALLTGNASMHLSLRCAVALAELVGEAAPAWELAAHRLRHALDAHPELFADRSAYSMDWYYPVLGGALPDRRAAERIDGRWADFTVPGRGIRCVDDRPWVTGAETCELVLALDVLGRWEAARTQLAAMQHLRDPKGSYWTGLVLTDGKRWPVERTTWTGATVLLAVDALSRTTGGNGLFRGEGLPSGRMADVTEGACLCSTV